MERLFLNLFVKNPPVQHNLYFWSSVERLPSEEDIASLRKHYQTNDHDVLSSPRFSSLLFPTKINFFQ